MYITNTSRTRQERTRSGNAVWWLLSEEIGAPNFELRYFELEQGRSTTYGAHPWEHEVYIVKGQGRLKGKDLEGRTVDQALAPGDAIFIGPEEEHQFLNPGEETLGFLCVIPKGAENDYRRGTGT